MRRVRSFFNLPLVKRDSVCGCHVFFEVGSLRLVDLRVWNEISKIPTSESSHSDVELRAKRKTAGKAELLGGRREEALEQHGPDGAALTSPGGELTSCLVKKIVSVRNNWDTRACVYRNAARFDCHIMWLEFVRSHGHTFAKALRRHNSKWAPMLHREHFQFMRRRREVASWTFKGWRGLLPGASRYFLRGCADSTGPGAASSVFHRFRNDGPVCDARSNC